MARRSHRHRHAFAAHANFQRFLHGEMIGPRTPPATRGETQNPCRFDRGPTRYGLKFSAHEIFSTATRAL
jgi:hypothetical protein